MRQRGTCSDAYSLQQDRAVTLADVLPIVDRVVAQMSRHLPSHISAQDLASAGKEALIEVLQDYVGSAEIARYYCVGRVRGAVLDELRKLDPLSRTSRAQVKRVHKTVAELELQLGRVPSDEEVAREGHLSLDEVRRTEKLGFAARGAFVRCAKRGGVGCIQCFRSRCSFSSRRRRRSGRMHRCTIGALPTARKAGDGSSSLSS